jgi:hypothetical protein
VEFTHGPSVSVPPSKTFFTLYYIKRQGFK